MAKPLKRPSYTLHKPTGQGRVRLDGHDHYCGPFSDSQSIEKYNDLVNTWLADKSVDKFTMTVDILCLKYLKHVDVYYKKNGAPTSEPNNIRIALRYLIKEKGNTVARSFGPVALQAVRKTMIDAGCVRTSINRMVSRVKRCFRWGVSQELLPPQILTGLDSVDGLIADRTDADESDPVEPVDVADVEAIQPYVSRQIWSMVQLQLLTAARPGEIRLMRTCDLVMSGAAWEYRPESHKMQHKGRERVIFLAQRAQNIVRQFLKPNEPEAYIFSPADAKAEFHAARAANRKTPLTPSQLRRTRKKNPQRKPSQLYSDNAYGQAIRKACHKAGIDSWHPHQLRHTRASEIRKRFDLEASQVVLGHARASTSEIYSLRDQAKAREVMLELG